MFLIVFGMFGGGAIARSILLAGITGAIAGAISMGLGEYIATKSQLEIMVSDISRERYVYEFRVIFCISLYDVASY
jgi:VIT1/CCC1 family predicted Fe2+/Mn2+ transporter